ncbi:MULTISPECIES: hypothetical protein [unclassified Clostridium]|nr:hypothetical protein [Clostridium sp.]MDU5107564.1 hypothetical protein [Clostridium sp.]
MYFLQDIYLPKADNVPSPIAELHHDMWRDVQESVIDTIPK